MSPSVVADAVALARRAVDDGAHRTVLGLVGAPGAGKSTLARHLVAEVDRKLGPGTAGYLPMDGFHLSNAQLDRLGRRDRKGAPDTFDAHGDAWSRRPTIPSTFPTTTAACTNPSPRGT